MLLNIIVFTAFLAVCASALEAEEIDDTVPKGRKFGSSYRFQEQIYGKKLPLERRRNANVNNLGARLDSGFVTEDGTPAQALGGTSYGVSYGQEQLADDEQQRATPVQMRPRLRALRGRQGPYARMQPAAYNSNGLENAVYKEDYTGNNGQVVIPRESLGGQYPGLSATGYSGYPGQYGGALGLGAYGGYPASYGAYGTGYGGYGGGGVGGTETGNIGYALRYPGYKTSYAWGFGGPSKAYTYYS